MQPQSITSLIKVPDGIKVVLAPKWLVEKLNDNCISLDVLSNGTLPDILSADDIIFYMAHIFGATNNIPALSVVHENTTDHSAYPGKWSNALDAAYQVEADKARKMFATSENAMQRMAIFGPEHCYDKEQNLFNGVELTVVESVNTMVVCYSPAKGNKVCNKSVIKNLLSFYGKFIPTDIILQTSLYAYLLLSDAQYKRRG